MQTRSNERAGGQEKRHANEPSVGGKIEFLPERERERKSKQKTGGNEATAPTRTGAAQSGVISVN